MVDCSRWTCAIEGGRWLFLLVDRANHVGEALLPEAIYVPLPRCWNFGLNHWHLQASAAARSTAFASDPPSN